MKAATEQILYLITYNISRLNQYKKILNGCIQRLCHRIKEKILIFKNKSLNLKKTYFINKIKKKL